LFFPQLIVRTVQRFTSQLPDPQSSLVVLHHAFGASQDIGLPKPPAKDEIAVSIPAYMPSAQFAMAARNMIAYGDPLAIISGG
jgi:hypothetical protein